MNFASTAPGARRGTVRRAESDVQGPGYDLPTVDIRLGDRVPSMFGEYARRRIGDAARCAPSPVASIRVRLADHRDSALANPFVAQADIVAERPLRVQVTGATARDAVDLLQARTRARLRMPIGGGATRRQRCEPQAATLLYLRPVTQRKIVRTKCFHLLDRTAAEAAADMALMDYDFWLFAESGAETESVLARTTGGHYRLIRLDERAATADSANLPLTVADAPAPVLDRVEALARLQLSGSPFLFFRDRELDRGCVFYHRYDGHYGFITSRR
ncbi:sigma 54 modulation/S30EA ribosomal C-terminal domain-containing protein [Nocardia nova]|uniref:sigma 54 modulation/S30EA ribosomal C-terminal domain-containing protein n=1 Tax=Nocardia nova TaxID=37330 RepID=UPI001892F2DA|nr:sigma 54 modulation/S30EA ribosomal C-terminal domain-containing protein [Nocardia nova]MBF6145880.1 sigma 54 modulation/S30EA ribosomal C-terminal domain-containing protein [Nocardia nova]